jgi:hypothetical protein
MPELGALAAAIEAQRRQSVPVRLPAEPTSMLGKQLLVTAA